MSATPSRRLGLSILVVASLLLATVPPPAQAATPPAGYVATWGVNNYGQLGTGAPLGEGPNPTPGLVDGLGNVTAVVAGGGLTLALRADGSVWAWGWNDWGTLGDGTTVGRAVPMPVLDPADPSGRLTGVTSLASTFNHTLALKRDGTLLAWGVNNHGQLGDGTTTDRKLPTPVLDPTDPTGRLTNVRAIAAGGNHSLVVLKDGTVRAWGDHASGQLGTGQPAPVCPPSTDSCRTLPVRVADPTDPSGALRRVKAVAAGLLHSLALMEDGRVLGWGRNREGQLGDATVVDRPFPVPVLSLDGRTPLRGIASVSAGMHYGLALMTDGTVRAWGRNWYGQLGDTPAFTRPVAAPVKGPGGVGVLRGVRKVVAGHEHALALLSDGRVVAWGSGVYGKLGDGTVPPMCPLPFTSPCRTAPVEVITVSKAIDIGAGGAHSAIVSTAAPPTRVAWAWGAVADGQTAAPAPVVGLKDVRALAVGERHALALTEDGGVWAWGANEHGQLGDGSTDGRSTPRRVAGLPIIYAIAAGAAHNLAMGTDGTVFAWGRNAEGQLGDGTTTDRPLPVRVSTLAGMSAIAAGGHASLSLAGSRLFTWGANEHGQLGLGDTAARATPTLVGVFPRARGIAAGRAHGLVLNADGTVMAWGANDRGQLGDGADADRAVAAPVPGLTAVLALAPGGDHTLALGFDGTVRAWGRNDSGQLGDGTLVDRRAPVKLGGLTGVTAIGAGVGHSLAVLRDGGVSAWGRNEAGQAGARNGSPHRPRPATVASVRGARVVAGGGAFSLAAAPAPVGWPALPPAGPAMGWTPPSTTHTPDGRPAVPGQLIIGFAPDLTPAQRQAVHQRRGLGGAAVPTRAALGPTTELVSLTSDTALTTAIAAYRADPLIRYAEPNYIVARTAAPNDTRYGEQWALGRIGAEGAWERASATPVTVAVLDCGIRTTHEDLVGKVATSVDLTVPAGGWTDDRCDHGTHVAAIIAAATNNKRGIAGVAPNVRLLNGRVLDENSAGEVAHVVAGIYWATDAGARVINLSLGSPGGCNQAYQEAIDYAWSRNVVVVAAAGNDGSSEPSRPAGCAHGLAVGSTGRGDVRSPFSNYGPWVAVTAPGEDILSATNASNTAYGGGAGTSMAAPHAAGLAALLWSTGRFTTAQQVLDHIIATADPVPGSGIHWAGGRINAAAALGGLGGLVKLAPVAAADNQSTMVTLRWSRAVGAVSYGYCIIDLSEMPLAYEGTGCLTADLSYKPFTNVGTATSVNFNFPRLKSNTTHVWQVRAYDVTGYWSAADTVGATDTWWTFTTGEEPAPFSKLAPAAGAGGQSLSPTLTWEPSQGAVQYAICVRPGVVVACGGDEFFIRVGDRTSSVVGPLAPNATYSWQVRAYNSIGSFEPANDFTSGWWTFTTGGP
ncbi:MAG: S8 family serine peptidase [Chloroflexi bacterium]|nr:S8 family serine peptidase [Chloroflexota bacterium]